MEDKFSKILSVKFENYKCFEDFTLDCHKSDGKPYQWTVLLGDNNTGKTNILRAIAMFSSGRLSSLFTESSYPKQPNEESSDKFKVSITTQGIGEWAYQGQGNVKEAKAVTMNPDLDLLIALSDILILGYGVTRYPSSTSLSQNDCEDSDTLFYTNKRLTNIEEWLMQLDYAAKIIKIKQRSN